MIELLQEKDIAEAVLVGECLHSESIWSHLSFDRLYGTKYCEFMINNPQHGFILVYKHEDKIIGGLVGVVNSFPFSQDKYSDVYILFLKKEFRRGFAGPMLMYKYIEEAKKRNVKEIRAGVNNPNPLFREKVEGMYASIGFTECGSSWVINNQ